MAMTEQLKKIKDVSAFSPVMRRTTPDLRHYSLQVNIARCTFADLVALNEDISEGLHMLPAGPSSSLHSVLVLTGLSLFSMFCRWM
jgi:hypothetical protein